MLELKRVNAKNVWEILDLKVAENQVNFVASNTKSIIEAYTTTVANGYVFPFGIYENDTPIGFVMIAYDSDDDWEDAPSIAEGNYCIWRFMIDQKYQNKGYGKRAFALALDFIRTFPCGKAEYCWLSYEQENDTARQLYHSFGFYETGEKSGDEVLAARKLESDDQEMKNN